MSAQGTQPGVKVLADDENYPQPVRSAEPEIRTLYLQNLVCKRLAPALRATFNFEVSPRVTNWDRQYDPRPNASYSYLSNLHRQLLNECMAGNRKLRLSWIQAMDLQFVLRENFAEGWDDPSDEHPSYEDYHLEVADAALTRFLKTFEHKP